MQCARCGFIENRPGSRMCPNCGAALYAPRRSGGGSGVVIAIIAVGGALSLGGAAFAYWWLVVRAGGMPGTPAEVACTEGTCPAVDPARETRLEIRSARDPELAKVRLVVPAGATSGPVAIRVSPAREPLDFLVRSGPRPSKAIGKTIHLEPAGTTFAKPVTLKIPYATARDKSHASTKHQLKVAVLHSTNGKVQLETIKPDSVDPNAGIITVSLQHFSDVVAVAEPDDPNVIKLDGAASGGGDDAPIKQWKIEQQKPQSGCPDFAKALKKIPCLTNDEDDFFASVGIDTEFQAVGDYHCPLPGFTDSRAGYRLCRLATYLDSEDGGWTNFKGIGMWNHIPVPPMRSGHEVALFNLIKDRLRTRPGVPLTQDDLLGLAMQSAHDENGKTNLSAALLTAHNVVRAFARPGLWQNDMTPKGGKAFDANGKARVCPDDQPNCGQSDPETWGHSPSDPMYPIFLDAFGVKSSDGGDTIQSLRKSKGLPTAYLGDNVFQNGIFASIPGVNPDYAGGCYYYYWIGVMAAAGGESPAKLGIMTESAVKSITGQGERGKAETACAYKGVSLVSCLTQAQKSAPSDCPDAGPVKKDAGITPIDAGVSTPPKQPVVIKPGAPLKSGKSSVLYCAGRCSCCIGGTKEEITRTMDHCLDLGPTAPNCVERCKRMSEGGQDVAEIHWESCVSDQQIKCTPGADGRSHCR